MPVVVVVTAVGRSSRVVVLLVPGGSVLLVFLGYVVNATVLFSG